MLHYIGWFVWCAQGARGPAGRGRTMGARAGRRHALGAALLLAAHLIKVLSCVEDVEGGEGSDGGEGARLVKRYVGLYTGPYFDPTAPNNITAQLGTHAYLPCKIRQWYNVAQIRQLSNKSVSWIRRRDAHILTVDRFTFIADERFQAFLVEATDTWTLQVKYVQARDAGLYECQVGTEPKMSHFVQLNVVVPKIEIVGEAELYVKAGSTVSLKCVVTQALEEPAYIFWYHNGARVLDYDRRLVDIRTERLPPDTTVLTSLASPQPFCTTAGQTHITYECLIHMIHVGNLIIYNPRREDSGNYSCSPSNLDAASVVLHVLSGEQPAAMQHGNAGWCATPPRAPLLLLLSAALLPAALLPAALLPAALLPANTNVPRRGRPQIASGSRHGGAETSRGCRGLEAGMSRGSRGAAARVHSAGLCVCVRVGVCARGDEVQRELADKARGQSPSEMELPASLKFAPLARQHRTPRSCRRSPAPPPPAATRRHPPPPAATRRHSRPRSQPSRTS
ncbi:hypothetical protein RR46_01899 [Papilio xuthus]|uniref:Ig-like domain-containing protein n=1 Tax=Papilio xuthus TaxID=66420 RepID=A0A194QG91_PAPXU|nr:hypothetical protein RR46_01899 [Papilio xuthus]